MKLTTVNFQHAGYDTARMQGMVKRLVEIFGADHVMWGSDMGNTMIDYGRMVGYALSATGELSASDRSSILEKTGRMVYASTYAVPTQKSSP